MWGGKWDSNPRSSVPQTDALDQLRYTHHINFTDKILYHIICFLSIPFFLFFEIMKKPYSRRTHKIRYLSCAADRTMLFPTGNHPVYKAIH